MGEGYELSISNFMAYYELKMDSLNECAQVHKAYSILQEDYQASRQDLHAHNTIPHEVWNLIWKVKIPLKIGIFVWKVMHDSIPTFLNLCNRGINVHSTCPLCNSEDESSTHLFLYCPFARAIWHGSSLGIHTYELNNVSVQGWVGSLLIRHKRMDQESMKYLQTLFTVLWSIWNLRNLVVLEDKQPNPIEVLLTAQNLSCKYHEIFKEADSLGTQASAKYRPNSNWWAVAADRKVSRCKKKES
ncbi:uncharacterized protein LOC112001839 isoform X1 [Quercus suber]|uniref:uncharacterized protein LOC112001839 isoform X1 n=1 Tax=Quercus suber TaxID=58331 RepID=UPI000CE1BCF0|nr:uncharacterized protein LOC112001839 isoform X3 [Quercus suber]